MKIVIANKPIDEHSRTTFYFLEIPETKKDILTQISTEQYVIYEQFGDNQIVGEFMDNLIYESIKSGTSKYNKNEFLTDSIPTYIVPHHCKSVFAYIGNDITPYPNIYSISMYDFIKLKNVYKSVRLATDIEMKNYMDNSVIISKNQNFNVLANMGLTEAMFLPENIPLAHINEYKNQHEENESLLFHILGQIETLKVINELIDYAKVSKQEVDAHNENDSDSDDDNYEDMINTFKDDCIEIYQKLLEYSNQIIIHKQFIKNELLITLDEIKKLLSNSDQYDEIEQKIHKIGIYNLVYDDKNQ